MNAPQRRGRPLGARSPVEAADHDVVGEAHPPPELQAAVAELPGQSARLQLGHGRQLGHVVTFDVQGCKTGRREGGEVGSSEGTGWKQRSDNYK